MQEIVRDGWRADFNDIPLHRDHWFPKNLWLLIPGQGYAIYEAL